MHFGRGGHIEKRCLIDIIPVFEHSGRCAFHIDGIKRCASPESTVGNLFHRCGDGDRCERSLCESCILNQRQLRRKNHIGQLCPGKCLLADEHQALGHIDFRQFRQYKRPIVDGTHLAADGHFLHLRISECTGIDADILLRHYHFGLSVSGRNSHKQIQLIVVEDAVGCGIFRIPGFYLKFGNLGRSPCRAADLFHRCGDCHLSLQTAMVKRLFADRFQRSG